MGSCVVFRRAAATGFTMRRTDRPSPFDHETQTTTDLTQEFWGPSAGWASHDERPPRRLPHLDDTGSLRAIRDGVAAFRPQRVALRDQTGEVRRTRAHGVQPRREPSTSDLRAQASIGDLAAGHYDEVTHDAPVPWSDDDIELTPAVSVADRIGLGGVDPLLLRLGILILVGVLLVPLALSLRSSSDEPNTVQIETPTGSVGDAAGAAMVGDVATSAVDEDSSVGAVEPSTSAAASAAASPETPMADPTVAANDTSASTSASSDDAGDAIGESVGDVPQGVETGIEDPATVDVPAERLVPECPQTYEAAAGDSWYRIADAADVTPSALMAENRATTETAILPGDDICLPSGATMPQPPATTPPAETSVAQTTQPTTTAAPTTAAPTTTVASTPSGSPGADASVDEIKDVIRSIFPESEWETAFSIVQRESRFDPGAYNGWCCYGLFQIYWSVHRSWLDDLGIDSSDDLLDPLLNVRAAHALWQRGGNSWSAWSTYDG